MRDRKPRRNTRQRQIVLETLKSLRSHPTAAELHQAAREHLPGISLGTVYRNLGILTRMGAVRRLDYGSSEARFECNGGPHHHLRCVQCGRVDDARDLRQDLLDGQLRDMGGYEVLGYRLELFGVCATCREDQKSDADAESSAGG